LGEATSQQEQFGFKKTVLKGYVMSKQVLICRWLLFFTYSSLYRIPVNLVYIGMDVTSYLLAKVAFVCSLAV